MPAFSGMRAAYHPGSADSRSRPLSAATARTSHASAHSPVRDTCATVLSLPSTGIVQRSTSLPAAAPVRSSRSPTGPEIGRIERAGRDDVRNMRGPSRSGSLSYIGDASRLEAQARWSGRVAPIWHRTPSTNASAPERGRTRRSLPDPIRRKQHRSRVLLHLRESDPWPLEATPHAAVNATPA